MVGTFRRDRTPEIKRVGYDLSAFGGLDAYTEENSLNPRIGCYGYNIQLRGGVLQNTIGVGMPSYEVDGESITLPSLVPYADVIKTLHHFRKVGDTGSDDKMLCHSVDGKFYTADLLKKSEFTLIEGTPTAVGNATFINYYVEGRDTALIFHSKGITTFDGNEVVNYEGVPILSCVTMLYERVFGISPETDKVYFSAPLTPTEFSPSMGGGSITIRDDGGRLIKILTYEGAIYIFKEHAIYRLSVMGEPSDYVLTKILSTHSKIYGNTIAVTPDDIIFLEGDRLQSFNGYKMKELNRGLVALIDSPEYATATYFDSNYFLACRLKTEGEKVGDERDFTTRCNNGVLVLKPLSGSMGVMRGADIIGFYPVLTSAIKEVFIVYGNGRSHRAGKLTTDGCLYGEPLEKLWRSPCTNFGDVEHLKVLKRIHVDTAHDLTLVVKQGGKEVSRRAYGYSKEAKVPFNTSGSDFSFEIRAEGDLFVRGAKLIFDFVRRYFT